MAQKSYINITTFNPDPLDLSKRKVDKPFWSGGPQTSDPTPWTKLGLFGASVAGTIGFGMSPIKGGGKGVDLYYKWARQIENKSPGKIFRTFAVSDILYPFTTGSLDDYTLRIPPSGKITDALESIYGRNVRKYTMDLKTGTRRLAIAGEPIIGADIKLGSQILGRRVSPQTQRLIAISRAYASSQIQRFNSLLGEFREAFTDKIWKGFLTEDDLYRHTPFKYTSQAKDFVTNVLEKHGLNLPEHLLSVKQGPALEMLLKLSGKAAVAGLAIHGLSYLDYQRRTQNRFVTTLGGGAAGAAYFAAIFRNNKAAQIGAAIGAAIGFLPTFDKGIYAGLGSLYTKSRLGYAKFSDVTGLTASAKKQEELTPGITKARTPLAFAGAAGFLNLLFGSRGGIGSRFFKGTYVGLGVYGILALTSALFNKSLVPGIFASDQSYDDLKKVYSGEKLIPVKKGRWWEFGRTAWEGSKVDYYRQHWYPRMLSNARDISLYGSEEEKWKYDPLLHPVRALFDEEFKYHKELKNYQTRPYPITGTYFEDVPFIGPILAATIGRIIKPPKYMHTEQWLQKGQGDSDVEALYVPNAGDVEPNYKLGGLEPGMPLKPYDVTGVIGEQIYKLNELRGLTGFMHGSIKEALTGRQDYFDQTIILESATRAYGAERAYWDLNLGGGLSTTEALRRYVPHRRRQIELYNPLVNKMPSWMPGSNYYIDFKHGDPYTKVQEGELRLPGAGYQALHPELKGINPEEYPLMAKFKILADVGMWSEEFKQVRADIQKAKREGKLSIQEQAQVQEILNQVAKKKEKREFKDYKLATDDAVKIAVTIDKRLTEGRFLTKEFGDVQFDLAGLNVSQAAIDRIYKKKAAKKEEIRSQINDKLNYALKPGSQLEVLIPRDPLNRYKVGAQDISMPVIVYKEGRNINRELYEDKIAELQKGPLSSYVEYSPSQRLFGTAWELISHKGETPLEYLTPFSPFAKFIHARSAIEEYEKTQVYGTESAFWQKPIENFLKPMLRSMEAIVDKNYLPEQVKHRRQIQEYFDKLAYLKYKRLAFEAHKANDLDLEQQATDLHKQTLFGVDPYGSFANILKALPGAERDFFTAFSNAHSPEERERILQLIPANEHGIYIARWQGQLSKQLIAEHRAKLSDDALGLLKQISLLKKTEGRPWTPQLEKQYEKEATAKVSYADWYRNKELESYFQKMPLPAKDWVGWNPNIDLEDIKLKVVQNLGEDMHDYGLWESRSNLLKRKPYIDDAAINAVFTQPTSDRHEVSQRLREILEGQGLQNVQITSHYSPSLNQEHSVDVEIHDDRHRELQRYVNNPDRISV